VLLIDDRYKKPEYQALFPQEWQPAEIEDTTDLIEMLKDFWSSHKS
jgi:Rad3-related DNA helicase